jgi:hypothetical protein
MNKGVLCGWVVGTFSNLVRSERRLRWFIPERLPRLKPNSNPQVTGGKGNVSRTLSAHRGGCGIAPHHWQNPWIFSFALWPALAAICRSDAPKGQEKGRRDRSASTVVKCGKLGGIGGRSNHGTLQAHLRFGGGAAENGSSV